MTILAVEHVTQPKRSKTCGQHCVAMMAGVDVADVIAKFGTSSTTPVQLLSMAKAFGLRQQSSLWEINRDGEMPSTAILKLRKKGRRNFHWACVIDGVIHDPSQSKTGVLANRHEVVAFMVFDR
jgi:hypothetical protein